MSYPNHHRPHAARHIRYVTQTSFVAIALAAASAAHAQDAGSASGQPAPAPQDVAPAPAGPDIVVTGSRVARPGFAAPTPVTAISASDIQLRAPATIADTLSTIPSFRSTVSPSTSGVTSRGGGIVTADLRGLGGNSAARTLVLLDGHRFVASGPEGLVDLKLIPQLMLKSIEVVTGGASAAYGSDAVAGVINFKLDEDIRGIRGSAQYGISQEGDGKSVRASLATGGSLASGLVTFIAGGDYSKLYGVGNQYSRDWGRKEVGLITNPLYATNGQPNYIIAAGVHPSAMSPGGLVTSGPLRGLEFLPNGQTGTFNFGTLYGATNSSMVGGDNVGNNLSNATNLVSPVESWTGLFHATVNASDAFKPYVEVSYGSTETNTQTQQPRFTGPLALTIGITNPYLPASVKTQMAANGLTTISVGRLGNDIGPVKVDILNQTLRVLGGFKGSLGRGWNYDIYYEWGRNRSMIDTGPNNPIIGHFMQAVAGCPGTTAAAGCVPINIFGDGSIQPDNYSFGTASFRVETQQRVASANLTGSPFNTWAGPVSIATGVEYRKEQVAGTSDPISQTLVPVGTSGQSIAGGFEFGNQLPINGSYNLWEVYAETVVPLLHNSPFAKALDLNGAVRRTDYSTNGAVTTWKLGLTWQLNNDLKLRGTTSRDIRAPNLNELYQFGGSQFAVVFDPVLNSTVQTRYVSFGNLNLKPEKARTWTGGVVYEPHWLKGAGISVDYYNIDVEDVIGFLSPSIVSANCQAGDQASCNEIVRNANGSFAFFKLPVQNLNALRTAGVDIEARYQHSLSLFGDSTGRISLRALGTYVDKLDTFTPAGVLHRAGTLSGFNGPTDQVTGVPHFTGVFDLTYSTRKWLLNLHTRMVGSGKFNNAFTEGAGAANTINRNDIPAYAYIDLSGQYNIKVSGRDLQLFGTISNLMNTAPPLIPSGTVGFANETSTNPSFYDVIGRSFTFGLRFKY